MNRESRSFFSFRIIQVHNESCNWCLVRIKGLCNKSTSFFQEHKFCFELKYRDHLIYNGKIQLFYWTPHWLLLLVIFKHREKGHITDMNSDNITNLFNNGYQSFQFLLTKISLKIPYFLFIFLWNSLLSSRFPSTSQISISTKCCHISNFYLNSVAPNCGLYKVGTLVVSTVNSSI